MLIRAARLYEINWSMHIMRAELYGALERCVYKIIRTCRKTYAVTRTSITQLCCQQHEPSFPWYHAVLQNRRSKPVYVVERSSMGLRHREQCAQPQQALFARPAFLLLIFLSYLSIFSGCLPSLWQKDLPISIWIVEISQLSLYCASFRLSRGSISLQAVFLKPLPKPYCLTNLYWLHGKKVGSISLKIMAGKLSDTYRQRKGGQVSGKKVGNAKVVSTGVFAAEEEENERELVLFDLTNKFGPCKGIYLYHIWDLRLIHSPESIE